MTLTVLDFTGKKLTLWFIAYEFVVAPTSTSRPPDITWQVFPGLPCFRRSSTSVSYTERNPKNKKRGRPGTKATIVAWKSLRLRLCASHLRNLAITLTGKLKLVQKELETQIQDARHRRSVSETCTTCTHTTSYWYKLTSLYGNL